MMVVAFVGMTVGVAVVEEGDFVVFCSLLSCDIAEWLKMVIPIRIHFHAFDDCDCSTFTFVFRWNGAAALCTQFREQKGKLPDESDNKNCRNMESGAFLPALRFPIRRSRVFIRSEKGTKYSVLPGISFAAALIRRFIDYSLALALQAWKTQSNEVPCVRGSSSVFSLLTLGSRNHTTKRTIIPIYIYKIEATVH